MSLFFCKKPRGSLGVAWSLQIAPDRPTHPAEHSHMLAEPIAQKNPPPQWATPNRPLFGRRPEGFPRAVRGGRHVRGRGVWFQNQMALIT